jgi:hypothetical protein
MHRWKGAGWCGVVAALGLSVTLGCQRAGHYGGGPQGEAARPEAKQSDEARAEADLKTT